MISPGAPSVVYSADHGQGTIERNHRRDAGSVHGELADGHGFGRLTGNREARQEIADGRIEVEPALAGEDAGAQGGQRFAHGRDAEHRIVIHGERTGGVAPAVIEGIDKPVAAHDGCADTGEVFLFSPADEGVIQCGRIKHAILLLTCKGQGVGKILQDDYSTKRSGFHVFLVRTYLECGMRENDGAV